MRLITIKIVIIIIQYLSRKTLQYKVLLWMGSCRLKIFKWFLNGKHAVPLRQSTTKQHAFFCKKLSVVKNRWSLYFGLHLGGNVFEASFLNEADHVFAGLRPSKAIIDAIRKYWHYLRLVNSLGTWRIQGRGPGGLILAPLFLDQSKARSAEKNFFWDRPRPFFF